MGLGRTVALTGILLLAATTVNAAILTYNAATPGDNATTRASWLAGAGIGAPDYLVDFESGFVDGQNISGVGGLFPAGFVIRDTSGAGAATIETGAGSIAGGNPVGTFSVEHNEAQFLELDFSANPVSYVAFLDIDHAGTNVGLTFVGGGTTSFGLDTTAGSGDSAEFIGIWRNDQPRITYVRLDASGDGQWGIDNIEYGGIVPIPEPGTWALFGVGALGLWLGKRRRARK